MPLPGKRWFHVTINTHNSWLSGDARGFRSRKHKIHSSGDYRNRPPVDEHAGLRAVQRKNAGPTVYIPKASRSVILDAVCRWAQHKGDRLAAMTVTAVHGHVLIELPRAAPKVEVGKLKRVGSLAVRGVLPGRVWSRGCDVVPVDTRERQKQVIEYITDHHAEGGATWRWGEEDIRHAK